ncbi:hypothetical protein DFJ73DRAFT_815714 [Zopfochytrium polystomum]|nr:hypothetical protein DFJ73DRAFT_815714 [Zopfochytrium polystomum]
MMPPSHYALPRDAPNAQIVARFLMSQELELDAIRSPGFVAFLRAVNPHFIIPSREDVALAMWNMMPAANSSSEENGDSSTDRAAQSDREGAREAERSEFDGSATTANRSQPTLSHTTATLALDGLGAPKTPQLPSLEEPSPSKPFSPSRGHHDQGMPMENVRKRRRLTRSDLSSCLISVDMKRPGADEGAQMQDAPCTLLLMSPTPSYCRSCARPSAMEGCRFQDLRVFITSTTGNVLDKSFFERDRSKDLLQSSSEGILASTAWKFPSSDPSAATKEGHFKRKTSHSLVTFLHREIMHTTLPNAVKWPSATTPISRLSCDDCGRRPIFGFWVCSICAKVMCLDCFEVAWLDSEKLSSNKEDSDNVPLEQYIPPRECYSQRSNWKHHSANDFIPVIQVSKEELEQMQDHIMEHVEEDNACAKPNRNASPDQIPIRDWDFNSDSSGYNVLELNVRPDDAIGVVEHELAEGRPLACKVDIDSLSADWSFSFFASNLNLETAKVVECDGAFAVIDLPASKFFEVVLDSKPRHYSSSRLMTTLRNGIDASKVFSSHCSELLSRLPFHSYISPSGDRNLVSLIRRENWPKEGLSSISFAHKSIDKIGTIPLSIERMDEIHVLVTAKNSMQVRKKSPAPNSAFGRSKSFGTDAPVAAVWDVFPTTSVEGLRFFLRKLAVERRLALRKRYLDGIGRGAPAGGIDGSTTATVADANLQFYLDAKLRKRVWRDYSIRGWRIEQRVGEAVVIPAGLPFQMCTKTDVVHFTTKFASAESLPWRVRGFGSQANASVLMKNVADSLFETQLVLAAWQHP